MGGSDAVTSPIEKHTILIVDCVESSQCYSGARLLKMGMKKAVLKCLEDSGGRMKLRKLLKTIEREDDQQIEDVIEKLKKKKKILHDGKYLVVVKNDDQMDSMEEQSLAQPTVTPATCSSLSAMDRYKQASEAILNKQQGICLHGKKYMKCRQCRDEVGGIEEDDVFFCIHGKRRDRCKEKGCGGKAFCPHG